MADCLQVCVEELGCKTAVAWALDLDNNDSIKSFVQRVIDHGRLDILICKCVFPSARTEVHV